MNNPGKRSAQRPQYNFPLLQTSELLLTLKGWGLKIKSDRALVQPTPDFVCSVLRTFLVKLGYDLDGAGEGGKGMGEVFHFDPQGF